MNKLTILGLILVIIAGLLLGFQAISSMMTAGDIVWKELTLMDSIGAEYFEWVDGMSMTTVKNAITYVIHLPLYIILAVIGGAMMILGGLLSR